MPCALPPPGALSQKSMFRRIFQVASHGAKPAPHMGSVAAWRPGVPCAMPCAFCAYDGPGMRESIKTVAAALSALRRL